MKIRLEGEPPPYPLMRRYEESTKRPGVDFKNKRVRVTSLIDPAWMKALEYEHFHEIEMTPHQLKAAMMGSAFHYYLEGVKECSNDFLIEAEVTDRIDGWQVTGHFDRFNTVTGSLIDYKTCTATKIELEDYRKWEEQLNIYAYLSGLNVKRLRVYYVISDYSPAKAKKNPRYPSTNQGWLDLRLWGRNDQLDFIKGRLAKLENIEPCTDEERWKRPTKWAAMLQGRTRALKLFDSESDARDWFVAKVKELDSLANLAAEEKLMREAAKYVAEAKLMEEKAFVEERPSKATRCESYCNVAKWCIHRDE